MENDDDMKRRLAAILNLKMSEGDISSFWDSSSLCLRMWPTLVRTKWTHNRRILYSK